MNLKNRIQQKALAWSLPLPFVCRHIEYSTIASLDDDTSAPNQRLLDISLQAIQAARKIDLTWVSKRMPAGPFYPDIWPGEHYKLLAGLTAVLQPRVVFEVGTFQGLSALAIKGSLPRGSKLTTVDIKSWKEIPNTAFRPSDFEDGALQQALGDLSDPAVFSSFSSVLSSCDLLFVDAPKNVIFEETFLKLLEKINLPTASIVVFDDIRQWNMLKIWRNIKRPKMDLTSFGHWTGTGIIDWNGAR